MVMVNMVLVLVLAELLLPQEMLLLLEYQDLEEEREASLVVQLLVEVEVEQDLEVGYSTMEEQLRYLT